MGKFIDLTGHRFGKLIAVSVYSKGRETKWNCVCDCTNHTVVSVGHLRHGDTKSCKCLRDLSGLKNNLIHGLTVAEKRLCGIWSHMKTRCYNPNYEHYDYYGGRGIIICEEWLNDNTKFYKWALGNGYARNLTIDRIDNNGNYEPSNCKWVLHKKQVYNRSNMLTHAEIKEIRLLLLNKEKVHIIATKYKVHRTTISSIKSGYTYTDY